MSRDMFEIRMDTPKRNALGESLVGWLEAQLDVAESRPVLLSGTTSAFSAGLDLVHVEGLDDVAMESFLRRVDRLLWRLFTYPAPTVACVEGHAIAGGCVLVQACDFRVSSPVDSIRIGVTEVALGACFPPAILEIMRYRLSGPHLERVLLGADLYAPGRALEVGLLDELNDEPRGIAEQWLAHLAGHPAKAYALTKRALRNRAAPTAADEERFVHAELPLWTSEELRARVRAALGR